MNHFKNHNFDTNIILINNDIFEDERGFLFEFYNKNKIDSVLKKDIHFVQDNFVSSNKNVFRGLHFQEEPFAQSKLLIVIKGEILDIILDIRKNSKSFLKWEAIKLSDKDKKAIFIPKGFAHGYLVLSNTSEVLYKLDNTYNPDKQRFINIRNNKIKPNIYNTLKKEFSFDNLILSSKDKAFEDYLIDIN